MSSEAAELPVGAPLWIQVGDSAEAPRRSSAEVTDHDGDDLVISAPDDGSGSVPAPPVGSLLMLRWTTERGVYVCAATLAAVVPGSPPSWRLRPTAGVDRQQRRDYARASFTGPVLIVPTGTSPVAVVKGEMSDLSEGGLRAQLRGTPLAPGTAVEAHLELDSAPVTLRGHVLRSDPVDPATDSYEIVVALSVREESAARLRRAVLRQQMLERRERRQ